MAGKKRQKKIKGFPRLSDLKIPKGGLLNPELRKITGRVPSAKQVLGR